MNYVIEYEVIGNKFCGIAKFANTGTPIYTTELCNSQEEASILINNFIAANTSNHVGVATVNSKSCCGR